MLQNRPVNMGPHTWQPAKQGPRFLIVLMLVVAVVDQTVISETIAGSRSTMIEVPRRGSLRADGGGQLQHAVVDDRTSLTSSASSSIDKIGGTEQQTTSSSYETSAFRVTIFGAGSDCRRPPASLFSIAPHNLQNPNPLCMDAYFNLPSAERVKVSSRIVSCDPEGKASFRTFAGHGCREGWETVVGAVRSSTSSAGGAGEEESRKQVKMKAIKTAYSQRSGTCSSADAHGFAGPFDYRITCFVYFGDHADGDGTASRSRSGSSRVTDDGGRAGGSGSSSASASAGTHIKTSSSTLSDEAHADDGEQAGMENKEDKEESTNNINFVTLIFCVSASATIIRALVAFREWYLVAVWKRKTGKEAEDSCASSSSTKKCSVSDGGESSSSPRRSPATKTNINLQKIKSSSPRRSTNASTQNIRSSSARRSPNAANMQNKSSSPRRSPTTNHVQNESLSPRRSPTTNHVQNESSSPRRSPTSENRQKPFSSVGGAQPLARRSPSPERISVRNVEKRNAGPTQSRFTDYFSSAKIASYTKNQPVVVAPAVLVGSFGSAKPGKKMNDVKPPADIDYSGRDFDLDDTSDSDRDSLDEDLLGFFDDNCGTSPGTTTSISNINNSPDSSCSSSSTSRSHKITKQQISSSSPDAVVDGALGQKHQDCTNTICVVSQIKQASTARSSTKSTAASSTPQLLAALGSSSSSGARTPRRVQDRDEVGVSGDPVYKSARSPAYKSARSPDPPTTSRTSVHGDIPVYTSARSPEEVILDLDDN